MNSNLRILVFSSSREGNSGYLQTAAPVIEQFMGNNHASIAFIPFASVNTNYEEYTNIVRTALAHLPYTIKTTGEDNAKEVIDSADAIMVGGGNTFKLLHDLYNLGLLQLIQQKVTAGTAYIGWSAGSNIAGPTICTSNDMPIINPGSFDALGFFPFQINPHYYNQPVAGFNGETRNQRLAEFLQLNPHRCVVALPEGTALVLQQGQLRLAGNNNALLLQWQQQMIQRELLPGADLNFLLQ